MKRTVSLTLVLALVCALLSGCGAVGDKQITVEDLTLTIPGYYQDMSTMEGTSDMTFAYGFLDALVCGIREEFSLFGDYKPDSLADYAQLVIEVNGLDCQTEDYNGILTFRYTTDNGDGAHSYLAAVFESSNAYWLVQFGCSAENFEGNLAKFQKILTSIQEA